MKESRLVDLSLPIVNGGGFGMPAQMRFVSHAARGKALAERHRLDPADLGGAANAMEEFTSLTCHTGTHFDAPWHYVPTTQGRPALTIDQIPLEWCVGHGVWLDLSRRRPGDDITADDLQRAVNTIDYRIKPMDIVLIKTGASAHYGQAGCDNMNAGVTREATFWLADQGVKLAGIDACCWDRPPQLQLESLREGQRQGQYMQGHRAAGERGMCILEWLTNLDLLPHFGFTVYAFPVKVERGTAGWVRVVAMVSEGVSRAPEVRKISLRPRSRGKRAYRGVVPRVAEGASGFDPLDVSGEGAP
jgi:kynurenine formamidase